MNFDKFLFVIKATGLILLGGIIGYAISFLPSQIQKRPLHSTASVQTCDLESLQKIASNLSDSEQKFTNSLNKYETLTTNVHNSSETLKQLQTELLTRFDKLESRLQNSQTQSNIPVPSPIQSETESEISRQIDLSELQKAVADMNNADFNTRQRALRALTLLGSPEIKQQIGQLILNEEEDISLRRDIIQNLDWHGLSEELIQLFENSQDYNIKAVAILAAQSSNFDENEKQSFEDAMLKEFPVEHNDFIQISILDYFANRNRDKLLEFSEIINEEKPLSLEVYKHLQFLLTPEFESPENLEDIPQEQG